MTTKLDWTKRDKHTVRKHDILKDYIPAWIKATAGYRKFPFKQLYIVDCFAGRGEYKDGEPGSPAIIMKESVNTIAQYKYNSEIDCYFIELDKNIFPIMEQRVRALETAKVKAHCIQGEFEQKIYDVFQLLKHTTMPMFFFIDPGGFPPELKIVGDISSYNKPEILLNLQSHGILRNVKQEITKPTLKKVYPEELAPGVKEEEIIDGYESFLKKDCRFNYVQHYPVSFDEKQLNVYYLIHATRNQTGYGIMKHILHKYGFGYTGPLERIKTAQTSFMDDLEKDQRVRTIKDFLLQKYKPGDRTTRGQLDREILSLPGCIPTHLTTVLKQLKEENRIEREPGYIIFK